MNAPLGDDAYRHSVRDFARVNHLAPTHDEFCRCRTCKPPLVGQQRMEATRKVEVAVLLLVAIIVILLLAR